MKTTQRFPKLPEGRELERRVSMAKPRGRRIRPTALTPGKAVRTVERMSTEGIQSELILARVRQSMLDALVGKYGGGVAAESLEVALGCLRWDHLAAPDLVQFASLIPPGSSNMEATWIRLRWPNALRAVLESVPVRDCAGAIAARHGGPGSPEFERFRELNMARIRRLIRKTADNVEASESEPGLDSDGDEPGESPDAAEDANPWVMALIEARLFYSYSEAERIIEEARRAVQEGDEDEFKPRPRRSRSPRPKTADGHHFADLLNKYQPGEKGGRWDSFIQTRVDWRRLDAYRILAGQPPMDDYDETLPAETAATAPVTNVSGLPQPEAPTTGGAPFELVELREKFIAEYEPVTGGAKVSGVGKKASIDSPHSTLAVIDLVHTAYVDPDTYAAMTCRFVPELHRRRRLEQRIARIEAMVSAPGWRAVYPGLPRFDALRSGPVVVKDYQAKWEAYFRNRPQADPADVPAIVQRAVENGGTLKRGGWNRLARSVFKGGGLKPEGKALLQAMEVLLTLAAAVAASPLLGRLRSEFQEGERLFRDLENEAVNARAELKRFEQEESDLIAEVKRGGLNSWRIAEAKQIGLARLQNQRDGTPEEIALLDALEAQLKPAKTSGEGPRLTHQRRRQLQTEYFKLGVEIRTVTAYEAEIEHLKACLALDARLGAQSPMTEETRQRMRRDVLTHRVELAAIRVARAKAELKRLDDPDGNRQRYLRRKKYKETDAERAAHSGRSKRLWVRNQSDVAAMLKRLGIEQYHVSRHIHRFEAFLHDLATP